MRVALVCPYSLSRPGGVQSHVLSLGEHLLRKGHDVKLFAPVDGRVQDPPAVEVEPVGRSIPIPANKSVSRLALSPLVRRRLERGFGDFRPEVVHVHEPLQAGVSLYTLSLRDRPPVVGSFHAAAERMPFYEWLHPFFVRMLRRIDVMAAVSPAARELIRIHFGDGLASGIRILPNGIELARFSMPSGSEQTRDLTVAFVGRLERRKGCDVLLRAWPRIAEAIPDSRLEVIGDGPLRHDLEALAARLDLENVSFRGRLPGDELVEAYRRAKVVCVPSTASESFGIVLLEAMASGACVVASDLPGYRWVGGDAVVYFSPGDADSLAEAVKALLESPGRMQRLSAVGYDRAAKFDWVSLVPNVVSAYEDAVRAAS